MSYKLYMPGQSLCYGRGLCENFLNISYSLLSWGKAKREDNIHNKRAKTAGAEGDGCFPAGAPLVCHDCLEGAGYLFRKELIHGIKCLAKKHHDQSQH